MPLTAGVRPRRRADVDGCARLSMPPPLDLIPRELSSASGHSSRGGHPRPRRGRLPLPPLGTRRRRARARRAAPPLRASARSATSATGSARPCRRTPRGADRARGVGPHGRGRGRPGRRASRSAEPARSSRPHGWRRARRTRDAAGTRRDRSPAETRLARDAVAAERRGSAGRRCPNQTPARARSRG